MKNHDEFMQAVYAKADVRRKQIKRRNTMIRNATVSFVCTFVVALAVVPISRMFIEQQPTLPFEPQTYAINPLDQEVVPTMDTITGGGEELVIPQAARMMVVDNNANNVALHHADEIPNVVDVLAANYLPASQTADGDISLPVVPRFAGAVTIESVDELLEFLAGLPANIHLLDQLMEEYDDEFFSENVLKAMPIGIGVPVVAEEPTQPSDEPTRNDRSVADYWHANVDSDVMLLLLMPVSLAE